VKGRNMKRKLKTNGWAVKRTGYDGFSWFTATHQSNDCMATLIFDFKYEAESYKRRIMKNVTKDEVVRVRITEV